MESSSPMADGVADGHAHDTDHQPKPRPLSAIAQQAYDRYGVLDPIKLDLMVRGIFITRADAAALPHRITADGCPEVKATSVASHRQRSSASHTTAPRQSLVTPTVHHRPSTTAAVARATPSVASSSARTDISAIPSDHEKWNETETALLIKLRAESVGFRYIADRFPGKNQKAVQEKFYKSIKDPREPRWRKLYDDLRAQHDGARDCDGTAENPIEISDEDTVVKSTRGSSESLRENTIANADADEVKVKNIRDILESTLMDIDNTMEDVKTTI